MINSTSDREGLIDEFIIISIMTVLMSCSLSEATEFAAILPLKYANPDSKEAVYYSGSSKIKSRIPPTQQLCRDSSTLQARKVESLETAQDKVVAHLYQNSPIENSPKKGQQINKVASSGVISELASKDRAISGVGKLSSINAVSCGMDGDCAFLGLLKMGCQAPSVEISNDQVLVAQVAGKLHVVARENTSQILNGITPARFGKFHMTKSGILIFHAWLQGGGVSTANDGVICRWSVTDGVKILAREGDNASNAGGNYGRFQAYSVSPRGCIALQSTVGTGVVIMKALPDDKFDLVAKTGQTLFYNGTTRSILSLRINDAKVGEVINDEAAVSVKLVLDSFDNVEYIFK